MANNSAFNLQGSAPQTSAPVNWNAINVAPGTTPQAKALSNASQVKFAPTATPTPSVQPAPKKVTVTTTDYHPPTTGLIPPPNQASVVENQTPSVTQNYAPQGYSSSNPAAYPGLINSAANSATGNTAIGQSAADIAKDYGQQIADVGQQGARFEAGQRTTGTTPVAEGNAAVTAQTTAAQQQALASGESAALQGTGQQLTAQQQQTSGLNTTAGLTQPSANFPFVFNPLTGTFSNASTGQILNAQDAAKAVLSNGMSYDQAKSALGYLGSTAESQLQAAIQAQNPNANLNVLQGQGSGQQALAQQLPTLKAAVNKAGGIQQTIENFLQNNPDINSNPDAIRNAATQWLNGQAVVDPKYTTLFNVYLPEYLNSITPVLGAAGNQTNYKTEIAQSFVNPNANASSILSTVRNVGQAVNDALANITSAASGGGTVAGGTSPGTPSGGSSESDPLGILQ